MGGQGVGQGSMMGDVLADLGVDRDSKYGERELGIWRGPGLRKGFQSEPGFQKT
jgi:hypothetical protein